MAEIKAKFAATTTTALTFHASNTMATATAQSSNVVDNSSNVFIDALLQVVVTNPAGTAASDKCVYVYAYGSAASSSPVYPEAITGTAETVTLDSPTNLRMIGVLNTPGAAAATYTSNPMSVAAAFGGILPANWGIVLYNMNNLTVTNGNYSARFVGLTAQSA